METSSDSDTTDEWIVLDDDGNDHECLIKDQASFEDDVTGCVDCPDDVCGISDARTTSLGFTEEGNPPDNGEVPPAEDLEVQNHVQNFVEQAEDLSDLSSYTKDELPEDVDMTPAVRHYVHKKNVNLNSLLSVYLVLAVIAAAALGFGNFLGWSYCSSLKGVLQKQEQMLEQLQHKLSDCNSHLNASNLLSSDSGPSEHSRPMEEIKHQGKFNAHLAFPEKNQKKTGEHWALLYEKNLRHLIQYPLSALDSRSDLSSFVKSVDKHGQTGVLRHVLDFQNMKPSTVNIKSGAEQLTESQERTGSVREFFQKPVNTPFPGSGLHSGKVPEIDLNTKSYKETPSMSSPSGNQWKESQLSLKFPELFIGKHFSDMATVLDMSYFNIAFPQKKGLESQQNFHPGSFLSVNRVSDSESSKIPNLDIRSNRLNLEDSEVKYNPSTQDTSSNYHTASLISSMNNMLSLQKMQYIREDHFKSNLNVTQSVFQELLENLREKLDDIKNFTLLPLFVEHSHYSQKAAKKLLKVFDNFIAKLLKYSDKFFQKNIHRGNKMDKLTGKMLSCMNKLNCKWQEIKDEWQHLIQHEKSSDSISYEESGYHLGKYNKKKMKKNEQDKQDHSECLIKNKLFSGNKKEQIKGSSDYQIVIEHQKAIECLRNVYFGEDAKVQVKEKSGYQSAVEQVIKEEFFGGRRNGKGKLSQQRSVLDFMENKFSDGRIKELLKDKRILEFLGNINFNEIPKEQVKSKSDYETVLKHLRNTYFDEQAKNKVKVNYLIILELLRTMYFGDMAVEHGIDTTNYFKTIECLVRNKFSVGKANEQVKNKLDYHKVTKHQKTVEHFRDVDFDKSKKPDGKLDDKRPTFHISKDELYDVRAKRKREERSVYWKTAEHHVKGEFSSRKGKKEGKSKSDVQRTIEHILHFAGKAEKQLKDISNYKKRLEYLVKDEFFGGRAKERVNDRSKSREQNYKSKDIFKEKIRNGKNKNFSQNYDKLNKKSTNSDFKNSEKILKYKHESTGDFLNSQKVLGKRNTSHNWKKN